MKSIKQQWVIFFTAMMMLSMLLQACQPQVPQPVTPAVPPVEPAPNNDGDKSEQAKPDVTKAQSGMEVFYNPSDYSKPIEFSAPPNFVLPTPSLTEMYQIAFLIDLSQSMYATCTPNEANLRFVAPRFLISLLQAYYQGVQLPENQIQIGVYGFRSQLELSQSIAFKSLGEYTRLDYDNLTAWYHYAQTDQGNRYDKALESLAQQFSTIQNPNAKKIIIIISDGWLIDNKERTRTKTAFESIGSTYKVIMLKPDCRTLNPNLQPDTKVATPQTQQELIEMYNKHWSNTATTDYATWVEILKKDNAFIVPPYTCTDEACNKQPLQLLKRLITHAYFRGLLPPKLQWMEDGKNEVLLESSGSALAYIKMKIVSSSEQTPSYSVRPGTDDINKRLISPMGYAYKDSPERVGGCGQAQTYSLVRDMKNSSDLTAYWIEEERFVENVFKDDLSNIQTNTMLVDTNAQQVTSLTITNEEYSREFFHIYVPALNALKQMSSSDLQYLKQCYAIVVTVLDAQKKTIKPNVSRMFEIDTQNLKFGWRPQQSGHSDYFFNVRLVRKVNNEPQDFLIEKNLALSYRYALQPQLDSVNIACAPACKFSLDVAFMESRFFASGQNPNPEIRFLVPFQSPEDIQDGKDGCYKPRTQNVYQFDWNTEKTIKAYAFNPLTTNEFYYGNDELSFDLPKNYSGCSFNQVTFVYLRWVDLNKEVICYVGGDSSAGWACKEIQVKVTNK